MAAKVLVPLAEGFEEIEAVTIIDVLQRAGADVVVAGLAGTGPVRGGHGIRVSPDTALGDVDAASLDMVVLPGGKEGAERLTRDAGLQALLAAVHGEGRYVGAICAGPMALGPSGLARERSVTSYPGFGERFAHGPYLEERVVVDGPVITSRGPGTALEFALTLVEKLVGREPARELADRMLVHRPGAAHEVR